MRITNSMTINNFLNNLYRNNKKTNDYNTQLTSNRKLLRISDDPITAANIIQAKKDLSSKETYLENVRDANAILKQTENSLSQINEIYKRMSELSTAAATDLYGETERNAIKQEVSQLKDNLLSIANTTYAGKYIFGGYNTTTQPFKTNAAGELIYNGINISSGDSSLDSAIAAERNQNMTYKIDQGISFGVGINGIDLMGIGDKNLFKVFTDFENALNDPATTAVELNAFKSKFKEGQYATLDNISEVGGKQSRLELVENRYEDDKLNLDDLRAKLEEPDQAEVITKLSYSSALYEATLKVGSMIIQPTLLDFLS